MNTVIVGFGGMGKVHYANAKLIDGVRIVGIVGSGENDRMEAEKLSLPFFESISEACRTLESIDVIDITTPTFLHKEHALEALSAGKDIIIEKPVALSHTDAELIFDEAAEKGARVVPAHVMRFTKEFGVFKGAVESGIYGKVLDASFSRISAMPEWSNGWLLDKNRSGLVPFDLHIHDLDMIFALFGQPESVESYKRRSSGSSIDEYFHVSYGYDGFTVNAEAAWLRSSIPFSASWRVIFERAVMECRDGRVYSYPYGDHPVEHDVHYDMVVSTGINVPPTGWYFKELSDIYSYLAGDSKIPLIPYSDIVEELKILENL